MSTQEIYHYLRVNDSLITGGQPTAAQLQSAAEEGFVTVINLDTLNSRDALEDEAGLVRSLGMAYYQIPVEWDHPTEEDFAAFERVVKATCGKTLIHCVANLRVTAFYALYALKNLGWSEAQADALMDLMWRGSAEPVWEEFIRHMKSQCMHDLE